jgi:hypothetical protein
MLLDIPENKSADAMQILKTTGGVVIADKLEGHPNILVIIEAADRERLVEQMMPVLDSVDHVAEDVHLLVSQENALTPCFVNAGNPASFRKPSVN